MLLSSGLAMAEDDRVREVLNEVPEDVRVFNEHVTVLASPWMGGRLPGTKGMEYAKDYSEYWFKQAGVEPGHINEAGEPTFRQPFPLGSEIEYSNESLEFDTPKGTLSFDIDEDFLFTAMGDDGDIEAPVVFIGYSVDDGPDGYESFAEDTDLTGKVAMMLRFEPMDESGNSRWGNNRWSRKAGFAAKFNAVAKRNPAGIILVNPPGADDPRTSNLMRGSNMIDDIPVFMMSSDAADELVKSVDPEERSLMDLRMLADEGTTLIEFEFENRISNVT